MLWVPCRFSENPDDSLGLDLDSLVSLSPPTLVRCAAHSPSGQALRYLFVGLLGLLH